MNNVVCQYCKHSINEHDGGGCHRKIAGGFCDCHHSPNYIAAQQLGAVDDAERGEFEREHLHPEGFERGCELCNPHRN